MDKVTIDKDSKWWSNEKAGRVELEMSSITFCSIDAHGIFSDYFKSQVVGIVDWY